MCCNPQAPLPYVQGVLQQASPWLTFPTSPHHVPHLAYVPRPKLVQLLQHGLLQRSHPLRPGLQLQGHNTLKHHAQLLGGGTCQTPSNACCLELRHPSRGRDLQQQRHEKVAEYSRGGHDWW
jgi:hypothetical protein